MYGSYIYVPDKVAAACKKTLAPKRRLQDTHHLR